MSEQYRVKEPWKAVPVSRRPAGEQEQLTEELKARLNRVETIAKDDPTAISTRAGWERWLMGAKAQRRRHLRGRSS